MSETKTELGQKAPPDTIRKIVAELTRQTNLSSDYAGQAGQYLKNQCERTGLEARMIRGLRNMERMDAGKRQALIRQTIHGWRAMGYFDQVDMFDDVLTDLREILAEREGGGEPAEEEDEAEADEEQTTAEAAAAALAADGEDMTSAPSETAAKPRRRGGKGSATLASLLN